MTETASCRRVAILTHTGRGEAVRAATRLIEGLNAAGIVCALPREDVADLGVEGALVEQLPLADGGAASVSDFELLVVLGGDGTILRGAEWVVESETPLLGVNLGHVGFLAEAESSELDLICRSIIDRSYRVEERLTIDVSIRAGSPDRADGDPDRGGRDDEDAEVIWSSFAVNEVSIEKGARERMLEVVAEVDDRPLSRWACDGVLVATPTGSTAYAFSAGGPIIWPGVEALLLLPLSAHALFARPMVLGPSSHVVIELLEHSATDGVVWCDGRRSVPLERGQVVHVVQGRHRLKLARLSEAPFSDRLVRKFGLRVEGWRGSARLAPVLEPVGGEPRAG
ncbi:NAD+ kinase [Friedmanniella endophytica]|uniref:NAD kinase n=1 Tax=Microlunatus kandeliicorticis TaxID=1759536 RepID=A0A7W3IU77_9ACTN|nr:NAD kinase [Microlunatus kandeliicorticis]MBA8795275.1 NAD+ kinase [Microlunatus kandeliicorticis]